MEKKEILKDNISIVYPIDHVNSINEWYKQIIESDARYVVFLNERTYNLALCLEYINDEKLNDSNDKEYLTITSFLSRCNEIANYYNKYREFPQILLCDYSVIYALNINHLIKTLEKNLNNLIELSEDELSFELIPFIKISSFIKMNDNEIEGSYEFNIINQIKLYKCNQYDEANKMTYASSFNLLKKLNNNYLSYSQIISKDVYNQIANSLKWKKLIYNFVKEDFIFEYVKSGNQVKIIYSMKLRKLEKLYNEYRLIPFVFLPNLDSMETLNIKNKLFSKLKQDKNWKNIENYIETWYKHNLNVFSEWLVLLSSQVFLKDFNIKYKINENFNQEDYNDQVIKLMRNYNTFGVDKTLEILKFTLNQNVLNFKDLNEIFLDNIKEHYILNLNETEINVDKKKQNEIKLKVEEYFCERASTLEKVAAELSAGSYISTERRSLQLFRGCSFILRDLNEGYTKEETEYMLSYFLQILDCYYFSISSNTYKDTKIVGISQFVNTDRQALLFNILHIYEYYKLLYEIEKYCLINTKNFEEEIIKYFNSGTSNISKTEQLKILKIVRNMMKIKNNFLDWNGNYLSFINTDEFDRSNIFEYKENIHAKQKKYENEYKSYSKKFNR